MAHEKSRPGNTGTALLLTETNHTNTDRDFDYDRRVIQPMPELAPEQLDSLRNDRPGR